MLFDGIKLVEGSEVQNLVVDTGTAFPSTPNSGELFYITSTSGGTTVGLYVYEGSSWVRQVGEGDQIDALLPDITTAATYRSVSIDSKGRVTGGTNPTTISGYGLTDAQPLDGDLTAIGAISATSGLLRKTATNTWSLDSNTYITGNQTITATGDATGSGTTTLALTLAATGVAAGSYGTASSVPTIAVDSKGRVTTAANTSIAIDASAVTTGSFANARIAQSSVTQHQAALTIAESQITQGTILARNAVDETISGNWTFSHPVSGQDPTLSTHFTTKNYVDNIAAGVNPKTAVQVTTNGSSITLSGLQTIDGYTTIAGDRVLVKDQATASQNGIYVAGSGSWTRATDFDGNPSNEVVTGDLVYVEYGTVNGNSSWILVTAGTITVGTTAMTFSVFSRPGDFTVNGGLVKVGNQFSVGTASSSRIVVNTSNIDLATTGVSAGTFSQVTVDAYGRVTSGSATQPWSAVVSTPTTIAGYGITDAQGLNANLTAVSGLSTMGLIARTGSGTATTRSVAVSGTGLSITNGDGVSGNPTITSNATNANVASTVVARDASGNFSAGIITAALSGNASTATALLTGRTISITGDATGTSANFDGTANATIALGLASVNTDVGTFGSSSAVPILTVNAKGLVTAASSASLVTTNVTEGTNLYFTTGRAQGAISVTGTGLSYASGVITSNATSANTASAVVARDGSGNFVAGTITAALSGNATTATTATNIAGGAAGSIPYQTASGATSLLATASGVLVGGSTPSYSTTPTLTGTNFTGIPAAAVTGTAWTQSSLTNLNQLTNGPGYITASASVSGNASTATALQTARTIAISGDVSGTATSFDGTANISISSSISAATVTGKALTGYSSTTGTISSSDSILSAIGKLNGNLTSLSTAVTGALVYQGTWNALTNSPALASGTGTKGNYYKVATAGVTSIDGISQWNIGDMIVFNGTTWDKIDGVSTEVTSVAGRVGAVTLAQADISGLTTSSSPTFAAVTATTFTGALSGNATTATSATSATTATNVSGGTTGQVPYQSASGTTSFVANAAGVLQAASTGATPAWTTTPTLTGTNFSAIPNGALSNSSVTINGVGVALGGSATVTAAAGTLTGSTLAAGVTASSLTSVGTLGSLSVSGNITTGAGYIQVAASEMRIFGGAGSTITLGSNGTSGVLTIATSGASTFTGSVAATSFSGNGASLTSLTAGNLTGTIPTAVLGNSSLYVGTTSILLNRASGAQTLTGISIDGNAGTATTANALNTGNSYQVVGLTATGLITSTATEAVRIDANGGYISGYNAGASTRTGYLQFNSGSNVQLSAEQSNSLLLNTAGGSITVGSNGNATFTNNIVSSVATGISAAGSSQGTATGITKDINVVSTVAAGAGVIFSTIVVGCQMVVINAGANPLLVYPPSGVAIDSLGANIGFTLPVGGKIMFMATSASQIYTLNATYA